MQISRYEVKRLLGAGAHGKVYLAHDPKLDRDVAVKLLAASADEEIRARFRLEARAIAALRHPNIIELYDYSGESGEELFLALEYIPGRSLFEIVEQHGLMSEITALCVGHDLALALEHAHTNNVVHRDVKPENILLYGGRIVLTDFGTVKAIAASKDKSKDPRTLTRVMGTPGFMAPEQFAGQVEPRTDLFGLGATLYNLTTGRIPYEGGSVDRIYQNLRAGKYEDPRRQNELLSAEFCQILARCLAPKAKDRFASASDLRDAIRVLVRSYGIAEIRDELAEYDKAPAVAAVAQRERSIEAMLKELKVALKDKDPTGAKAIMRRLQTLAPLDERAHQISGISLIEGVMRPLARDRGAARVALGAAFAVGVAFGALATWIVFVWDIFAH
jgi:eukaryotic-like serine/threonine-protein kinase